MNSLRTEDTAKHYCARHSEGISFWSQTQTSLHCCSWPAGGAQDTLTPESTNVQMQRRVKCWFPVRI
jgi:hypothetical protein